MATEEEQAFEQLSALKITEVSAVKKENVNVVSIGHVGKPGVCSWPHPDI